MRESWERLKGESSKAYAHFCLYRDLGPERSLRKLIEDGKATVKQRRLEHWSAHNRWVDRAQAYDDELERQLRAKNEKARKEMAERHARLALAGQNILVQQLNAWSQAPPQLSPSEAARWLDVLVKIERLARGEPTEIGKTEHSGSVGVQPDTSKMTDGERREEMIRCLIEMGHSKQRAGELALALLGENDDGQQKRAASHDSAGSAPGDLAQGAPSG